MALVTVTLSSKERNGLMRLWNLDESRDLSQARSKRQRFDMLMQREARTARVHHEQFMQGEIFQRRCHGFGHRRRRAILDLDADALAPEKEQQIELRSSLRAPVVGGSFAGPRNRSRARIGSASRARSAGFSSSKRVAPPAPANAAASVVLPHWRGPSSATTGLALTPFRSALSSLGRAIIIIVF